MNQRERVLIMIRTDRGSMTVWDKRQAEQELDAYAAQVRAEVLAGLDAQPEALAWASAKVAKVLDFLDESTQYVVNVDQAAGLRKATEFLRRRLLGGKGCVVGAFDARRLEILSGTEGDR
jgi:hypothetical protein